MAEESLDGIHFMLSTSFIGDSMQIDGDAEKELGDLPGSLDLEGA